VTLPIGGIVPVGLGAIGGVAEPGVQAGAGTDGFASVLASTFDKLQSTQNAADTLGAQAATGDLKDVHDYIIARTEASLATEMVVTIKNKAVDAFNEIMRMPV
jgi:flagellar hook-basal body complex protein FliE